MHHQFRKNKDGQRLIVTYEVDWKIKQLKLLINTLMKTNHTKKVKIEGTDDK